MKRTFIQKTVNNHVYNILALPNTNFFKFEIINKYGSDVERIYNKRYGKNVYGISHLVEHLAFRNTRDYTTKELLRLIKNEGSYNASTDYSRINYWFQTSMDKVDIGINLVLNYTLNTLEKISEEEFEIDKKVVYNEAKRYADNHQTMFYFDVNKTMMNLHDEDNVIGIPDTIDTFTLEDCINIKDIFLQNSNCVYNITYDPTVMDVYDIIAKIESAMEGFSSVNKHSISQEEYLGSLVVPNTTDAKYLENDSEQSMTYITLDAIKDIISADYGNSYLSSYAKTSLNDIIREEHGLTYSVGLNSSLINSKPYTNFYCDVSKGNEEKLMELFKESINSSVDAWDASAYKEFIDTKKLKRTISLLDQKAYGGWHTTATWHPEMFSSMKDILAEDIDGAYGYMDSKLGTESSILEYMEGLRGKVNKGEFSKVSNY